MKFFFFFAVIFLISCSQNKSGKVQVPSLKVEVAQKNRKGAGAAIKVSGRTQNSVEADHKLFEAQGFQTAYDRFLQMDFFRRSARARMAELLGKEAIEKDLATIGEGFTVAIANSSLKLKKSEPEAYSFLESYARGVNRFIREMPSLRPDWVTLYKKVTGDNRYTPSSWTPEDSISIGIFLTFYLSNNLGEKFSMGALYFLLSKINRLEYFNSLIDLRPLTDTFIFSRPPIGYESVRTNSLEPERKREVPIKPVFQNLDIPNQPADFSGEIPNAYRETGAGSNNWAVSKDFTGTGETYLANDPHLFLMNPSIMHEVALDSRSAGGTIRVRGVTPPGALGVLIGHNQDIAWGDTNNPIDVDDLSIVALNKDETQYLNSKGEWTDLEVQTLNHQVKGQPNATPIKIKSIPERGILISDFIAPAKKAIQTMGKDPKGFFKSELKGVPSFGFAYRWVGHEGGTEIAAVVNLNRAKNFVDFKKALDAFHTGAQNFIYADKFGNIGYYSHGNFPIRTYLTSQRPPYIPTFSFEKVRQADKPDQESIWSGYRTHFLEKYNPSEGFIVTANNDPVGSSKSKTHFGYSNYLGFSYDLGFRAQRIIEMIRAAKKDKNKVELEDMKRIQSDVKDLFALQFLEWVRKLDLKSDLTDADQVEVLTKLLGWDGDSAENKIEPGLFYYWVLEVTKGYFKIARAYEFKTDRLSMDRVYRQFVKGPWSDTVYPLMNTSIPLKSMMHYLEAAASSKNEAMQTEVKKLLTSALASAISVLKYHKVFKVEWGKLNTLTLTNPLEGVFPVVVDKTNLERGGSFATVCPSRPTIHYGSLSDSSEKKIETRPAFGAALRIIFKLKEGSPIESQVVIPGNWNYGEDSSLGLEEFQLWKKNGYRDLVSFVD